ncbi:MAG: hypothetical protein M1816_004502 [Peltula sp. TS41687]|nr:MAG: hypothetical protein M1816_004502 [Peltula sp. TS41687]
MTDKQNAAIDVSSDEGSRSEDEMATKKPIPRSAAKAKQTVDVDLMSEDDDVEMIPATKALSIKQHAAAPEPMDEDEDDDDADVEDPNGEEYVVEAILDHQFDAEHLPTSFIREGANDILTDYHREIGGRPIRKMGGTRLPRDSPQGRKGNSSTAATPKTAETREKRIDTWKPPSGTWEDDIQAIDTVEMDEGGLFVYLHWNNGRKSRHPMEKIYKHCPQKMLKFYEQHLQFREGAGATNGIED